MTLFQTTTMAKVGCDGTDGQRLRQHLPGVRQCSDNRDRGIIWFGDLLGSGRRKGRTRLETALSVGFTQTMDLEGVTSHL